MEREIIKLTNDQWRDLVHELYLELDGEEVDIKIVAEEYDGSGRHTEYHHIVFQRLSDNKYFKVKYEVSVKDSMGWSECNWQNTTEAVEVFPKEVTTIIYE